MDKAMLSSLSRVGISAVLILVTLVICKIKKLPIAETLAIRKSNLKSTISWLGAFIVLVVIEELALNALGEPPAVPWTHALPVICVRAFGIILVAPVGEELLFRGLLFYRISKTRLGTAGAILIPALLFSVAHVQYDASVLVVIFIDGMFFGVVRHMSGSVLVTILLHSLGNLYAVIERLPN